MSRTFTIIIPVYNEEDNLERLEMALLSFLKTVSIPTSILFVNDGSTDNSKTMIESIYLRNNAFNFISLKTNKGLSTALKAGFDFVDSDLIGYMDADLQTSPDDFNLLLEHVDDYHLITGLRLSRKDTFLKKMTSKTANVVRRIFTQDGIDDTGCPLKVIHSDYAKRIPMFRGLHRFLPAMILLQNGKIKQVPIRHFSRIEGKSKFGLRNRFFGPLIDCFAYLWMKKKYVNYTIEQRKSSENTFWQ